VQSLYQILALPGEQQEEFVLARSFVPIDKQNVLQSMVFARSDPEHYGELVVFEMGANALSPFAAGQVIQRDTEIAKEVSLLKQKGSDLEFGEMRVLPIGGSLLYVQPFYIKGEAKGSFLVLQGVAVTDGERAVLGRTFDEALSALLGTPSEPEGPDPGNETVSDLLLRAQDAFEKADEAAARGDYEDQGRFLDQARDLIERAAKLSGLEPVDPDAPPDGGTTPTTAPDTTSPDTTAPDTTATATTTTFAEA
jgi:uncharacterized membrane protein (UPF0182 family)